MFTRAHQRNTRWRAPNTKSSRGYKGFTFYTGADVTLEEDLRRRSRDPQRRRTQDGELVDSLDGAADVRARVFRHVEAFQEDPVRILRLGRFAARDVISRWRPKPGAVPAHGQKEGEDRRWWPGDQERTSRGLMAKKPSRMLDVLRIPALARVMPELQGVKGKPAPTSDRAAEQGLSLAGRRAMPFDAGAQALVGTCVPTECNDYARLLPEVLRVWMRWKVT